MISGAVTHTMRPGCCSSISPCPHQRRDPTTLCDVCQDVEDRYLGREKSSSCNLSEPESDDARERPHA